jgi:hypothetical protein
MSEPLIRPLTVTSVRKLPEVAAVPLCAFVWLMSDELIKPLAVVSSTRRYECVFPRASSSSARYSSRGGLKVSSTRVSSMVSTPCGTLLPR